MSDAPKTEGDLVSSYLAERAAPWRLVGRYEEALRQIKSIIDSRNVMSVKLVMIRHSIEAANIPKDEE